MPDLLIEETISMKTDRSKWRWFAWIPVIVLLDQLSKWWIVSNLQLGDQIALFPGLNVTLAHNYGVAFGLFNDNIAAQKVVLLCVAILITAVISLWLYKTPAEQKAEGHALVFIMGGAIGNIIDRLYHGYVIDFVDFYVKSWHWWTFNIADSFITVGAAILLISIFFERKA